MCIRDRPQTDDEHEGDDLFTALGKRQGSRGAGEQGSQVGGGWCVVAGRWSAVGRRRSFFAHQPHHQPQGHGHHERVQGVDLGDSGLAPKDRHKPQRHRAGQRRQRPPQ